MMKKTRMMAAIFAGTLMLTGFSSLFAGGKRDSANVIPATRIVRDSNGTDVEIPFTVTKVAPVIGAFAQMTEIVSRGSGVISAAFVQNITPYFKKVFPDYERTNPKNYASTSVEDLIASGTQVAYGPSTLFSAEQRAQLKAAGVAYVEINNVADVAGLCESFTIIGNILGGDAVSEAAKFVAYYKGAIESARKKSGAVAAADKVRFLNLSYSASAYSTTNGRDISNEYVEAAGGINVARDYMGGAAGNTLTVDAEQIIKWNPQVIMTNSQNGRNAILNDAALRTVAAVRDQKVYVCPYGIYLWSVRSGEGAMLPLWLGTKFYPARFADVDMNKVVKDYFKDFYHYDIPAAEIATVLAGDTSTGMTR
jgi:iron complex transport system substrate-binding protein